MTIYKYICGYDHWPGVQMTATQHCCWPIPTVHPFTLHSFYLTFTLCHKSRVWSLSNKIIVIFLLAKLESIVKNWRWVICFDGNMQYSRLSVSGRTCWAHLVGLRFGYECYSYTDILIDQSQAWSCLHIQWDESIIGKLIYIYIASRDICE